MSTPEQPTFSHSGERYLLGYTGDEYGIWERARPGPPISRFPKTDAGWAQAWDEYRSLESGSAPAAAAGAAQPAAEPPAPAGPSAPTAQLPAATPAGPAVRVTPRLLAQVLTVMAWVLVVLFPLAGIARLTQPILGFFGVMEGLANIALGVALWAVCLTLARVAERGP